MRRFFSGLLLLVSTVAGVVVAIEGVRQGNPFVSALGICFPFAVIAATSPIARRLATRNARRRPRETLLILLGALLGTTIVASAATVGDSFTATIRDTAYSQLGPVDEVVTVATEQSANEVASALATFPRDNIDGMTTVRIANGAVAVAGENPRATSDVRFNEISFAEALAFGDDVSATGMQGEDPKPGNVAISEDLANELEIGSGQTIDLYFFGEKRSMVVDRVLPAKGIAGLRVDNADGGSLNVFVPPGTLVKSSKGGEFDNRDIAYMTLISNKGDVLGGRDLSKTVTDQLNQRLTGVTQHVTDLPFHSDGPNGEVVGKLDEGALAPVEARPVKDERLKDAADAGRIFSRIFVGIGSFTIIAGVLLLINIFTMLAQERQSELGMLRAIGMRRRSLISTFSFEGFLYGIGAAILGITVGIGVGWLIVRLGNSIFTRVDESFSLVFAVKPTNIAWAFLAGLGITVLTVVLASLFISRMNVIRAIRELPDATLQRKRIIGLLLGLLLAIAGVITTLSGINSKNEFAALLGPGVLAIGVTLFFRRWIPTKLLLTATSLAVLVWTVFAFTLAKKVFANPNPGVFVLQGVQLTAFAVMFISANQEHIGGALRRLGGGTWSMALRLGLAYPLARRGRTGLLLAMFSLVMFVLVFITTVSHVLTTGLQELVVASARGADIAVERVGDFDSSDSTNAFPVEALRANPDISQVAPMQTIFVSLSKPGADRVEQHDALGVEEGFVGNGAATLQTRDPAFQTDDDVYKAVVASDNLMIVRQDILREKGQKSGFVVGERVEVRGFGKIEDPLPSKQFTVVGIAETGFPAVIGQKATPALAPSEALHVGRAFIKVAPGKDPVVVARQISGLHVGDSIEAYPIQHEIEEGFTVMRQFLMLIQGYLAIGLFVGVAGLGVVMVRAVRERRRQIGMLRAMGFPSSSIRQAFFAESAFIAGEGIVIGAALALIVLARLFASIPQEFGLDFSIPWVALVLICGGTFLASILATALPAHAASRIPPAVALRTVD